MCPCNDAAMLGLKLHNFLLQNVKDTHREKALSNKTPALTKSTNMGIWVVDT